MAGVPARCRRGVNCGNKPLFMASGLKTTVRRSIIISPETICIDAHANMRAGGHLWRYLHSRKTHRSQRGGLKSWSRIVFHLAVIAQRVKLAGWEGNTRMGDKDRGGTVECRTCAVVESIRNNKSHCGHRSAGTRAAALPR